MSFIMDGNIIRVQRFDFPEYINIGNENVERARRIFESISSEKHISVSHQSLLNAFNQLGKDEISVLKHRLSPFVDEKMFSNENSSSKDELLVYETCILNDDCIISDDGKFTDFIEYIGCYLRKTESLIRRTHIRTVPEKDGGCIEFIEAALVPVVLKKLRQFIINGRNENPLLCAIISAVCVLTTHPLPDGDGRLSRILFNYILRRSVDNYIPMTEICHAARSGYVLSVREAMLYSEWESITQFYLKSLVLLFNLSDV